jgi:hypothetical protein
MSIQLSDRLRGLPPSPLCLKIEAIPSGGPVNLFN